MSERKEEYWSRFAETYEEDQTYILGKAIQQAVLGRLSEERDLGAVVELGCGSGLFTKAIAGSAEQVLATDLSDEMVAVASRALQDLDNVTVQKADGQNTALPPDSFDTVLMINVVHFVENPKLFLLESHRILRPEGLLLVADYTGYHANRFEVMKMGMRYLRKWGRPPPYFERALSPDGLSSLATRAGFAVEDIQLLGDKIRALYLKGRKT